MLNKNHFLQKKLKSISNSELEKKLTNDFDFYEFDPSMYIEPEPPVQEIEVVYQPIEPEPYIPPPPPPPPVIVKRKPKRINFSPRKFYQEYDSPYNKKKLKNS